MTQIEEKNSFFILLLTSGITFLFVSFLVKIYSPMNLDPIKLDIRSSDSDDFFLFILFSVKLFCTKTAERSSRSLLLLERSRKFFLRISIKSSIQIKQYYSNSIKMIWYFPYESRSVELDIR